VVTETHAEPAQLVAGPGAEAHAPTVGGRRGGPGRLAKSRQLGRGVSTRALLVVLLVCFELDQLRAVFGYSRLATDEDQTLLWAAGRELVHLRLHEPNFYGQNYNTVFEALPGELLHLLGLSLALAIPLGTMLMASACWLVLAWAAHRRGHQLAAVLALALPVCLTVPYLLLVDAPRGVLTGDLAGAVAVAAALVIGRPRLRLAVLVSVGGLAVAWDNAAALVVIPALAGTTVADLRVLVRRPRRTLLAAGAGLLLPAGWWLLDHVFYTGHPTDLTAPGVNTKLALSVLLTNVSHPERLFGFYAPQLAPSAALALGAIGTVVMLAVVTGVVHRRPAATAAALGFAGVLVAILSAQDTLSVHPDLYLSGSRFLLPMPLGLWVVCDFWLAPGTRRAESHRRRLGYRAALGGLVTVAVASLVVGQLRFPAQVRRVSAVDASGNPVIVVVNPNLLLAQCDGVSAVYRQSRAQLLVTNQRDVAYGCAAQNGLSTLDPEYERRGWLLRAAATTPLRRILIVGWSCRAIPRSAGTCRATGQGTVLLSTPARAATLSLERAGIAVRGAGQYS
jgi:hypothetical protein